MHPYLAQELTRFTIAERLAEATRGAVEPAPSTRAGRNAAPVSLRQAGRPARTGWWRRPGLHRRSVATGCTGC